jgi:hypothetical protein
MYSLPIPLVAGAPASRYSLGEHQLGDMLSDLTRGQLGPLTLVHADPDLCASATQRAAGWRPAFGQVAAAQSHLAGRCVDVGDLFLFFGWFRQVERVAGTWRFARGAPDVHMLFGWLQVGERIDVDSTAELPAWLGNHPHVEHRAKFAGQGNTIYLAQEWLGLDNRLSRPGGGTFRRWADDLQLTVPDQPCRSLWRLPRWFMPEGRRPLSYHGQLDRWRSTDDGCELKSVGRGQEFVLDASLYPEAIAWARDLIEAHG